MKYRTLGKTGLKVSILGFGAMRLPIVSPNNRETNVGESIKIIRQAIDNGINYIDSAYIYDDSEEVVGKALQEGYREKVIIQTKSPFWLPEFDNPELFEKYLDEELKRLQTDYIDIYLIHGMKSHVWEKAKRMDIISRAKQAKKEGKIRHIGFSFHDPPNVLAEIVNSGDYEVMLVQYNILDTQLEEVIADAAKRGMGVSVMGPVGAGRLAIEPPEELKRYLTPGRTNFVDLAFKFVWSNPNITTAFSGMNTEQMVAENIALCSEDVLLSKDELSRVKEISERYQELCKMYCSQCSYCMPCKQGIDIPYIFEQYANWRIHNTITAKVNYRNLGYYHMSENATACIECGECESKCPQGISIIEQLKQAHDTLSH